MIEEMRLEFFRPHGGSGVWRNEYQGYFLKGGGYKGGQFVGLTTLPPLSADCLEIESLNVLKPSGL
jgi:hypothetical protein